MRPEKTQSLPSRTDSDPVFNRLVEELVDKLQAFGSVELDAYRSRYPEQAEKLEKLIPAIELMAGHGPLDQPSSRRAECDRSQRGSRKKSDPIASSAISACSARSAAAAWRSFTKPSRSRCGGGLL